MEENYTDAFRRWIMAGQPDLQGMAGDVLRSGLGNAGSNFGKVVDEIPEPSTIAPGMETLPATITPTEGVSLAGGLAGGLGNVARTLATPDITPSEEAMMRGTGEPYWDLEARKLAGATVTPKPPVGAVVVTAPPAKTPTTPSAPILTVQGATPTGLMPPYVREPKASESEFTPKDLEEFKKYYTPKPAPIKKNEFVELPSVGFATITAPEKIDYAAEAQKIIESIPRTPYELMEKAGMPHEKYQLAPVGNTPLQKFFAAAMQGLAGIDTVKVRDAYQKELDAKWREDLGYIVQRTSLETQTKFKILDYKMNEYNQKVDANLKALDAFYKQRPDLINNANFLKSYAANLGMDPNQVGELVESMKDPNTGQINLYVPKWRRDLIDNSQKSQALQVMFPELSPDEANELAITGQFPERARDYEKKLRYDLDQAYRSGDQNKITEVSSKYNDYMRIIKKSKLDEKFGQMEVLYSLKPGIVAKYGPDYYNKLEKHTLETLIAGKAIDEKTANARNEYYDLKTRTEFSPMNRVIMGMNSAAAVDRNVLATEYSDLQRAMSRLGTGTQTEDDMNVLRRFYQASINHIASLPNGRMLAQYLMQNEVPPGQMAQIIQMMDVTTPGEMLQGMLQNQAVQRQQATARRKAEPQIWEQIQSPADGKFYYTGKYRFANEQGYPHVDEKWFGKPTGK